MDTLAGSVRAALFGGPSQAHRTLRLHTALGFDALVAETVEGWEAVDAGFRLDLTALSTDAHLDLQALVGQPALLEQQTADGGAYRPWHGHVTAMERLGSNGGLARYRLVIEPFLAFARYGRDSYAFQDLTAIEITEQVLSRYQGQGALVPAWRWDLLDPAVYLKRSLTVQYAESPLAFLQRLWAEEGLFHVFEHAGDAASDTFGTHTLVLADHNGAFGPHPGRRYRFHRADATERADSIQQWRETRRLRTGTLTRASWDHRALGLRPAAAQTAGPIALDDRDVAGPYAYPSQAVGQRRAQQHLEALQVDAHTIAGAGTVRTLAAGQRFVLTQHDHYAGDAAATHLCLRVHLQARNNLDAQVVDAIEQRLGQAARPAPTLPAALSGLAAIAPLPSGTHRDETFADFYRNTFEAIPAPVPYRPQTVDGHGRRLHPKPQVVGVQPAIVVGDGGPISTDRDHRVRVQFIWQRGADSSTRQAHPGGADNAPGTAGAWTWVRVLTPWAGANFGSVFVPRVGQAVSCLFLEGDPDRPLIIGAAYDGRGNSDAAHNQVAGGAAGATGNAPAWFAGNAHPAVFSGLKTQALASSQSGSGGYNQLVADDTPGQGRLQLTTTQADSALRLGHLKQQTDNLRQADRGFGAELATRAAGAVRGGSGVLLTTEPGTQQLTAPAALGQLAQSTQLVTGLVQAAQGQQAGLDGEPKPEDLPAIQALTHSDEVLKATQTGSSAGDNIGGGDGQAPAWSEPFLVASSPAGVAAVTPADLIAVAGTHAILGADQDLNWASQGELAIAVAGGIALYTHGQAAGSRPNAETGIALHAAAGAVRVQAQANTASVAAEKTVTLSSTTASVTLQAPARHLLLTAAGAYLRMQGGDIELGAPGRIEFKASLRVLTTPQSASGEVQLPTSKLKLCEYLTLGADKESAGAVPIGG